MANIRLKKGQVNPNNPHATSVTGPQAFKGSNIDNVQIESRTKPAQTIFNYTNIIKRETPQELTHPLDEIIEYGYEIDVYNYSEAHKGDFISLEKALKHPKYMLGNCSSVTDAILENMDEGDVDGDWRYEHYTLDYKQGTHHAILAVDPEGEEWIIDYTAGQYDKTLPVPLKAERKEWETLIDYYVETLHGDTRRF